MDSLNNPQNYQSDTGMNKGRSNNRFFKYLPYLLIVIVLIIGGAAVWKIYGNPSNFSDKNSDGEQKNLNTQDSSKEKTNDNIAEIINLAISEKSQSSCDSISIEWQKERCYANVANVLQDDSLCEDLSESFIKNMCYFNIAQSSKDLIVCDSVTDEGIKAQCYVNIAIAKENLNICNDIPEGFEKNDCYTGIAKLTKNEELCEDIEPNRACFFGVALAKQDANLCENIKGEKWQQLCYKGVAAVSVNAEMCGQLSDSDLKDNCYTSIAKAQNNVDLCKNIKLEKNKCYQAVAVAQENISICNNIPEGIERDNCYTEVAFASQNSSLCEQIPSASEKNMCFTRLGVSEETVAGSVDENEIQNEINGCMEFGEDEMWYCLGDIITRVAAAASETKNPELCKILGDEYMITLCEQEQANKEMVGIVENKGDLSECDDVEDPANKEMCISLIATGQENDSICQELSSMKNNCIENIAIKTNNLDLCSSVQCSRLIIAENNIPSLCASDNFEECGEPTDSTACIGQAFCFDCVLINNMQIEVCDRIDNQILREACINTADRCFTYGCDDEFCM